MNVALIGVGRVGLVAAAGIADFGVNVLAIDIDEKKIESLRQGIVPFHEPGLNELVQRNTQANRLCFSTDLSDAVKRCAVLFIAVQTDESSPGNPNLVPLFEVSRQIGRLMKEYKVLVIKSTVPIGTARRVAAEVCKETSVPFDIVSNPEFLREGSAVENFLRPDRIVLGGTNQDAVAIVKNIYRPLYLVETPFVTTDHDTAELAKYASNAFLSLKISFINEIANLCDAVGGDVHDVAKVLGLDKRIGPKFLHPGPGFGGSCLPKDSRVLIKTSREYGCVLGILEAALESNKNVCYYLLDRMKHHMGPLAGRVVGVLGLAYKPFTDDLRESRSLDFVRLLLQKGAIVRAHDPAAGESASR